MLIQSQEVVDLTGELDGLEQKRAAQEEEKAALELEVQTERRAREEQATQADDLACGLGLDLTERPLSTNQNLLPENT